MVAELQKDLPDQEEIIRLSRQLHLALSKTYEYQNGLSKRYIDDIKRVDQVLKERGWNPIFEDWYHKQGPMQQMIERRLEESKSTEPKT
jgi:hypothetical protein